MSYLKRGQHEGTYTLDGRCVLVCRDRVGGGGAGGDRRGMTEASWPNLGKGGCHLSLQANRNGDSRVPTNSLWLLKLLMRRPSFAAYHISTFQISWSA